jgi:photosystem II stability/assembly factor-like uncharacterized protein
MKRIFIFLLFSIVTNCLVSQSWMEKLDMNHPDFYKIQKEFYESVNENPAEPFNTVDKDDVITKFKRWEYFWETRVDANGDFPKANILWNELEKYTAHQKNKSPSSIANWSFAGPSTFLSANAGGIGRVNCIAFHPTLPNTFWVGTPGGGLWKTDDAGVTWITTTDNLPVLGISDIAVDYSNPNIIYITTGDSETVLVTPGSIRSVGVLKSLNGGITFNPTGLSISLSYQNAFNRIIIHPTNPSILIVAGSDGIFRTTNGGSTWTFQQAGWFTDLEFKPSDPDYIYASTLSTTGTSQIFRTTDNGITWNQVTALSGVNRIDLAVTPSLPNVVSALCADTYGQGGMEGIYSSTNSGVSFALALNGDCTNNMLGRKYNGDDCGGQGVYDIAYSIHPTDPSEIWIAGINNWKTDDGGATFNVNTMNTYDPILNPVGAPYLHSDKHKIAFHPMNPNYVYTCSDAGLHVTNDGGASWFDLSDGLGISQLYRIGTSATAADKVLCGLQDNGLKQKTASGWKEVMSGDNMEEIIDPLDTAVQYSCALTGILYRTLDNWNTKDLIAYNIPGFTAYVAANGLGPGAWVSPFVMDPVSNQTLYLGYNDIWKTTDRGDTWSLISNFGSSTTLKQMAIAPSNNQVIYASTYDTLYVTANGGTSWTYTTIGSITGTLTNKISYITVHPTNPLVLWLTISGFDAGNKVFKSINGGISWTNISGTLPNIPVNCLVYQNGSNDGIYIGSDLGVFYKDNTLTDWITYDNGLPNVQVNELEISYIDNKLWAATFGRGLWKSDLYTPVGFDDNEINDKVLIFPNPTSGIIELNLQSFSDAELQVFNVIGEQVFQTKVISSKTMLDLKTFSKGIYFVKVASVKGSCVKKIIIH